MVLQFLPRIWIHMEKNEKRYIQNYCQLLKSKKDIYTNYNYKSIYPIQPFCHRLTGHRPFWNLSHQCLSPPFMSHSHLLIALCALKVTGLPHKQIGLHLNIENWIFISTSPQPKKICISNISKNLALQFNCSPG